MKKTLAIAIALFAGGCSSAENLPTASSSEAPSATIEVRSTEVEPLTIRLFGGASVSDAAVVAMSNYFGRGPGDPEKANVPEMSPGDQWVASVELDSPATAGEPWLIVAGAESDFDGVALRDRISGVFGLAMSWETKAETRCARCEVSETLECVEITCPADADL